MSSLCQVFNTSLAEPVPHGYEDVSNIVPPYSAYSPKGHPEVHSDPRRHIHDETESIAAKYGSSLFHVPLGRFGVRELRSNRGLFPVRERDEHQCDREDCNSQIWENIQRQ